MNIFYLDRNPQIAARLHCDKHVVKMILESAQILSTVHHVSGSGTETMYKPTHARHPCTIWAAESQANYQFLYDLFIALLGEYTHRYGKQHATGRLVGELRRLPNIPNIGFTEPAQAMPDEYKDPDSVRAYKRYYLGAKAEMLKYTKREFPKELTI